MHARWRRAVPWVWSLLLALFMLGPALAPGYVLSYDMVWVPDLALRPDFWGLGSGLPRAVPSDAVVALLDQIVGGMLLQKVILLGALVLGGAGAARLTDRSSSVAQLVASGFYVWNPFVAERLLIGHWPLLVGYAALPWIAGLARSWRTTGRVPAALLLLLPVASLSASAGLASAVVLVAFATTRRSGPVRGPVLTAMVLAANAPWVVAGVLHAVSALTDPLGARVFALADEGPVPAPLAAIGLGGIWNTEVVPGSRTGVLGWVSLVLLLVLVGTGLQRWRAAAGRREVNAFLACWVLGWGLAVLTWAAPGAMGWAGEHIPGAGLVRDGARLLALCAPLLAAVIGHGAARLISWLGAAARPTAVLSLLLLPVAAMPDVALGWAGRLTAVDYPTELAAARTAVARAHADGARGDVLLLPLSSYRQPAWNAAHKVLDPVGRFLTPDYVAGDDLLVSGRSVAGEDPRARAAARALMAGGPAARRTALARLGIGLVVTEKDAGPSPTVSGPTVVDNDLLHVQRITGARDSAPAVSWVVAMVLAWTAYAGLMVVGAVSAVRLRTGVRRRRRATNG